MTNDWRACIRVRILLTGAGQGGEEAALRTGKMPD